MTKPVKKTIEMTKAQWKAWDKHLRSGEIEQGRSRLQSANGAMCCLGVLQYALEGKVERGEHYPSPEFLKRNNIVFKDASGHAYPPDHDEQTPYLTNGYADSLNDGGCHSFKQIASLIKSRVKFTDK